MTETTDISEPNDIPLMNSVEHPPSSSSALWQQCCSYPVCKYDRFVNRNLIYICYFVFIKDFSNVINVHILK